MARPQTSRSACRAHPRLRRHPHRQPPRLHKGLLPHRDLVRLHGLGRNKVAPSYAGPRASVFDAANVYEISAKPSGPKAIPRSVRYDQVNAMLLNEFLKEHRKVQELGEGNGSSHGAAKSSGSANSEGERATGSQQTSAANRSEQSVKPPSQ